MALAISLGKRGLGQTWPNPSVGAVIVEPASGRVIACGWTSPGGRPHAEANAIASAVDLVRGATLYVTLEPCAHWGKTPPCSDAIIASGIARVVYGVVDPDPRVAGQGLARLRAHGVKVEAGPLAHEARWLMLGHELRLTERRPFIQMKMAVDASGRVPAGDGGPVWATGAEARAHGHLLRAEADAILVGHGTVAADDPDLTCRLPGLAWRSPVRVVLSTRAELPASAKMLGNLDVAPVWVACAPDAPAENIARLEAAGVAVVPVPTGPDGRLDIRAVTQELAERGITRLLVEGGPAVAQSFFNAGLIDEAVIITGGAAVAGRSIKPFGVAGLETVTANAQYRFVDERRAGADRITIHRRAEFWPG
ncbi:MULTISPECIES: bifunctional diaminohydroxyphosphoribosylaminopyrimidine deaminase/5-amino-6-(5-phosphoribosylamino)uracil reductase RibD [Rhodomicrobium]|uniref:bifunctional diaminohydroxyphosphoribosylaminopyrimidine deaminase/5-amino-6-(5-phosphoribosylamino)uracil reductase RibD n=1 Tax=Rhodomicrobium TaxID=1068 RepID=UPI0014837D70|nr:MULTISPECIES: bifunctional diaminohydroxyphosphoribosylaminopyrimidine deaminase/5-amino-6-(5-phosphoribosylamino)uracil reductase RibD [Rhodomicrobium]